MKNLVLCTLISLTSLSAFAGTAHRGDDRVIGRDAYNMVSGSTVCAGLDMQTMGSARQSTEADAISKARARLEKFDSECANDGGTISEAYVQPSSRTDIVGSNRVCSTPGPVVIGHFPGRPNPPARPVFCQSIAYGCEIYSHAEVKHVCN